ncbi:MAG: hypothetical protein EOM56_12065 [Deltaproteobacteria bacterium]|nr:hypothetical protein [Deltaproteobacteria bacterium]
MSYKSVYFVSCQGNPDMVFGVAESSAEAEKIIDSCVDAARDSLDTARYNHVIDNTLDPTESLDDDEYAETGLIQQAVAGNYSIIEMPLNTHAKTNLNSGITVFPDEEGED